MCHGLGSQPSCAHTAPLSKDLPSTGWLSQGPAAPKYSPAKPSPSSSKASHLQYPEFQPGRSKPLPLILLFPCSLLFRPGCSWKHPSVAPGIWSQMHWTVHVISMSSWQGNPVKLNHWQMNSSERYFIGRKKSPVLMHPVMRKGNHSHYRNGQHTALNLQFENLRNWTVVHH